MLCTMETNKAMLKQMFNKSKYSSSEMLEYVRVYRRKSIRWIRTYRVPSVLHSFGQHVLLLEVFSFIVQKYKGI